MQSPRLYIPRGPLAQRLVAVDIRVDNARVNIVQLPKRSEAATRNPVEAVEAVRAMNAKCILSLTLLEILFNFAFGKFVSAV